VFKHHPFLWIAC